MPTYRFRRKNGKEFEKVMMISEMEEYRKKHPNLELCIPSTLNIISGTGTLDGKQVVDGKMYWVRYLKHILVVTSQSNMGKGQQKI